MDTPQKIGRYEIVAELGRGAMGTVYRAKDPAMDRVVALKTIISVVLESHQGDEFRERFYREARAAGGLTHPGIVPIFDVGEHEGVPYMVMEFISGRTLADSVSRGERLSIDRVCEMGQKIAEALGYAHQHGVVHRDIKPANILLTSREAHGIERPKITDFGVAKMAEGQTTRTGQMVGTPAFMPPEQFTGAPIDGRADIFSLGVVLYWLATGEQPFPGDSLTAVSYKVVHTEPVPPSKLNPAVPAGLENIILKCLAKNPEERYQTGEELARDLGQIRSGAKTSVVRTAPPQTAVSGIDPDATVVGPTLMGTLGPAAATRPVERAAAPQAASNNSKILIGTILAVIVAAGGWYAMSGRRSADTPVTPSTAPTNQAPTAATNEPPAPEAAPSAIPVTLAPNASEQKEIAGAAKPAPDVPAKKTAPPAKSAAKVVADVPAKTAPKPEPATVDFDPKALDPKQNAKLKIDAGHMPAGLEFTLEMNGKIYLQKSGAAAFAQNGDLFVPPGVQEFRVRARSGAVEKTSNTVSAEFKAKKKSTLKIELRMNGSREGSGMPQGLYEDSQIVVTLK
ncbi:MAG: protein kinase [Acidobacteriia bacterium]|nr:protein kinase [Terriglobia bacterium]